MKKFLFSGVVTMFLIASILGVIIFRRNNFFYVVSYVCIGLFAIGLLFVFIAELRAYQKGKKPRVLFSSRC